MEFAEVVRRRHMVRSYTDEAVPRQLVERVVACGLRAPSAGFSQGWAFLILEGPAQTGAFWQSIERPDTSIAPGGRLHRLRRAPMVIVPLAHKAAYLARYAEPDKIDRGLDREEAWPAPYWDIDTAFATMTMLLAATDAGLGALFFGLFNGLTRLHETFSIPHDYRPIGAMTLGWPAPDDPPSPSLARGRRSADETVHYGRWGAPAPQAAPGTGQTEGR
ncbi:MAG: hypothetical protein NVSMB12_15020 [Acidimicrobiales bacterium]